jgi:hypothetical protein
LLIEIVKFSSIAPSFTYTPATLASTFICIKSTFTHDHSSHMLSKYPISCTENSLHVEFRVIEVKQGHNVIANSRRKHNNIYIYIVRSICASDYTANGNSSLLHTFLFYRYFVRIIHRCSARYKTQRRTTV